MQKKYTISIYTENSVGLLNRVSAIFQKRHINIISITSSASEIEEVSRFIIVVSMTEEAVKKVVGQIEKKIEVINSENRRNSLRTSLNKNTYDSQNL